MSVVFIVELRWQGVRLHAQGSPRGAGKAEIERAAAAIEARFPSMGRCDVKVRHPRGRMPCVEAIASLRSKEDARVAATIAVEAIKAADVYVAGTELYAGDWIREMRSRGYSSASRSGPTCGPLVATNSEPAGSSEDGE